MKLRASLLAIAAIAALGACDEDDMGFDREVWAAESGKMEGENRRAGMVSALPAAGVQPGASRTDMRELLGEPDVTGGEVDIYFLGRASYGIDLEQLRITYDADEKLVEYRIDRS